MVALIDGFSLRNALELMDALRFRSQKEKDELSHLYEAKVKTWAIRPERRGTQVVKPRLASASMTARSIRQASCARPMIICATAI
jgi:hypothetical protein